MIALSAVHLVLDFSRSSFSSLSAGLAKKKCIESFKFYTVKDTCKNPGETR